MSEHKFTNALATETSPYLLQHAHNPVEWHPWSDAALRRAREEDKPILLSIGYSACHWCHVMEHESFENEAIARLMNQHFINIKVDREERPDLDSVYMAAVQMMTGSGGWPMTVFLTPDGVPFYGGTYFPPEDRHGLPGLPRLLLTIAEAYKQKKEAIHTEAAGIVRELQRVSTIGAAPGELKRDILDSAARQMMAHYDSRHGGFGSAPKFPPSMSLSFLLRTHVRTHEPDLLEAVEHTLQRMACGGIYDQLGGGFHRYSVDDHWLVPHFEKMLYDNALLSRTYLEAYLLTKDVLYRHIVEETLDYVRREMTSPEGGFYSTQDADSEGHEGRFFIWTPREIEAILGAADAALFCRCFDVTEQGNFEGRNILNLPRSVSLVARLNHVPENELLEILARGRRLLFEGREKRIKPGRDEKILTAWNGLMLRSFAEAAGALDRTEYRAAAVRNAQFLLDRLQRDGRLLRSYKDGASKFNAYLEDYACLVDGLLSLYETTFESRWIEEAKRLAQSMADYFWDPEGKSFFFTSYDHETLIHRPKDSYDNATPSGNSVAAHALLRLAEHTGEGIWRTYATSILESMAAPLASHPSAFSNFLCALDFLLAPPTQIAVAGNPDSEQVRDMVRVARTRFLPNRVIACGSDADTDLLKNRPQIDGMATAYICRNHTCSAPVTTPLELERLLKEL